MGSGTLRVAAICLACCAAPAADPGSRRIAWDDTGPLRPALEAHAMTAAAFPAFVERTHAANMRRVREGDLDHLVFYLLQSMHFTDLPAIEPALSAKALVDALDPAGREDFLRSGEAPPSRIPSAVRARIAVLLRALEAPSRDVRQTYFRSLVQETFPEKPSREAGLEREYLRAMRFIYRKEFVAQRAPNAPEAVADLYRTRGLSTDTAVEAGFAVYAGLGVLKALEPDRRIKRVLIIGPGLDLAPRTALLEAGPPESYQPWAVIDALLALDLARAGELTVVGGDINPRVVAHLRRSRAEPPTLTLGSELRDGDGITLAQEYREYFAGLGRAIGRPSANQGRAMTKTVAVAPSSARALDAAALDIVTERLAGPPFDLIVATNILPYFDDVELMLAMSNVAGMLAPGGVFLHNEARPALQGIMSSLGLPSVQSRQVIIASVRGAAAPLADSVWLHRKVPVH